MAVAAAAAVLERWVPRRSVLIVEYIRYAIPLEQAGEFEAAYATAEPWLRASPQCLGYELSRCVEDPTQFIVRIVWSSTEDHLQGFRKSERFPPFLAAIRPYIGSISEMRHYTPLTGREPADASRTMRES
jgi:quinol monooxygenase YgiN